MKDGSAGATIRIAATFAAVHSLLASHRAKQFVAQVVGPRYRNGLYRLLYNLLSTVLLVWAVRRFLKLPDRDLYRMPAPLSYLMYAAQIAALSLVPITISAVGPFRSTGVTQLRQLLAREEPELEPEAQGPAPDDLARGTLPLIYRLTRHPGNLSPLLAVLLFPRMTVNRATLAALVLLYALLGSIHEETRLRAAYGEVYDQYRQQVAFLLPLHRGCAMSRGPDGKQGVARNQALSS